MRVTVVGAGVIGLSCAVRLLQAGHQVTVVAREHGEATTSAVAAALWYPYLAFPRERVAGWGATTYAELTRLAEAEPAAGVRVLPGRELLRAPQPNPWWAPSVPSLRRLPAGDLPAGYADGWRFDAPVVDMSVYLPWLAGLVDRLGGSRAAASLNRLPEPPPGGLVVNCTGLGAQELVGDATLVPVRGQVVLVRQAGLTEWALDESDPQQLAYVVPRLASIVCGGTALPGVTDLQPDPATTRAVLARCQALVPELAGAEVLDVRVGLRPSRPSVRLERLGDVVHCYGHGGAGVTLSWGCAAEVAALVHA